MLKCIILPSQARDKHRECTQKETMCVVAGSRRMRIVRSESSRVARIQIIWLWWQRMMDGLAHAAVS
jgi:hypothetical protein